MYLQLHENNRQSYTPAISENENPYIYIPAHLIGANKGLYIREDYFDGLTDEEHKSLMWQLAPFQKEVQVTGMSEEYFLSSRADRKKKREEKRAAKALKKKDKSDAKNEIRQAKADAIRSGKAGSGAANVVQGILTGVGNVAQKFLTPEGTPAPEAALPPSAYDSEEKPWYKKPVYVVGGAVGVGLLIYGATKLRKRKKRK